MLWVKSSSLFRKGSAKTLTCRKNKEWHHHDVWLYYVSDVVTLATKKTIHDGSGGIQSKYSLQVMDSLSCSLQIRCLFWPTTDFVTFPIHFQFGFLPCERCTRNFEIGLETKYFFSPQGIFEFVILVALFVTPEHWLNTQGHRQSSHRMHSRELGRQFFA